MSEGFVARQVTGVETEESSGYDRCRWTRSTLWARNDWSRPLRSVLDSPQRHRAVVLVLLLVFGLGWTFGPRQLGLVFLLLGFLTLFVGGTATMVIPRRRAAARLAADRTTRLAAPDARIWHEGD